MAGRQRLLRAVLAFFTALTLVVMVMPATHQMARAASVEPQLIEGNPTCDDVAEGGIQLKIEGSGDLTGKDSGRYTDGTLIVDLEIYETETGWAFDWFSNIGVAGVVAKGGAGANLYHYVSIDNEDTLLHSPLNPSTGDWYGLSHISFCYGVEPTTTTTVEPTTTTTVEPTTTVDEVLGTQVTTTTIEDEVLGTQLTTSTTLVEVSPSGELPFTGVSTVWLWTLGLSLVGAGISALGLARTKESGRE